MELNPEQKRQLARVYAYILSLAAKKKQAPVSKSLRRKRQRLVLVG